MGTLEVEAVTPAGQADQLSVEIAVNDIREMGWAKRQGGRWVLKISPVSNPGVITIYGGKGYIEVPVTN